MIYSATKLRNAINKKMPENSYEFDVRNISINGDKRGCSGVIGNKEKGTYVYVTTEKTGCSWLKPYMFRRAESMNDCGGSNSVNLWASDFSELVKDVVDLLENPDYPMGKLWG